VHTEGFTTFLDESWLEEGFGAFESWDVDGNDGAIWELVVFGSLSGGLGVFELGFIVL